MSRTLPDPKIEGYEKLLSLCLQKSILSIIIIAWSGSPLYNSNMITYKITTTDHCRLVESFLRKILPDAPLSYLRKLVKSGHVTVNDACPAADAPLLIDDTIRLKESARTAAFLTGKRSELDIIFEDDWIIVFNKQPGLAVHRAAEVGEHNLVELGRRLLVKRGIEGKLRPVNRLDRGTSGAIIMAKSPTAAGMFGRMLKEEGLEKLYLSISDGKLPEEGNISAPLDGKESETRYRVLFRGEGRTFAAVYPVTGRMHQIRRHFKLIGHPIIGDRRYGGPVFPDISGHLLHSFRTRFTHPAHGRKLTIFAPLPEQFLNHIANLAGDGYFHLLRSLPEIL